MGLDGPFFLESFQLSSAWNAAGTHHIFLRGGSCYACIQDFYFLYFFRILFFYIQVRVCYLWKNSKVNINNIFDLDDLTGPINYYRSMIDPDTMGQEGIVVKVPTLLIWGGEDRFLNISMAHQSAK